MHEPVLLDVPARLPGVCICGAAGEVIDTKLEVDGYGRVYLCTKTCAPQAARLIGWLPPETADELAAANQRADEAAGKLRDLAGSTKISAADALAILTGGTSTVVLQ